MTFFQFYILFGISGLTLLTTFALPMLFSKYHEKAGLTFLYLILVISIVFDINKWNLIWLTPLAFIIPYYISKIISIIPVKRFRLSIKYIIQLFL